LDQAILVSGGHALVKALDAAGIPPRLAMWVHFTDTDTWKLWTVPPNGMLDKREYYRQVAEVIAKNRVELGDLSASDVEMVSEKHPGVQGIGRFLHAPGLTSAHFSGNVFNGFYLPDGIILRSAIERRAS
jgi:hypothetical protein